MINTVQRTDPIRFNPFRKDNVLPKLRGSLSISDPTLIVYAASAFFPVAGALLQSVFDRSAFSEARFRKYSTMDGFKALIEGRCDFFIATGPSKEQREEMDRSGLSFRETVLLYEPLAFLVNRENPVDGLTSSQIRDIYEGKLTSWPMAEGEGLSNSAVETVAKGKLNRWTVAGGEDLPITPFQLETGNGSRSAFDCITDVINERQTEVRTMPEMVDRVAEAPGAISYSFYSYYTKMYANRQTKVLNIDDRGPMADDYPFVFPLYLFSRADNEKPSVKALSDWVKTSEGQEILRRANLCWRSI